MEKETISKIKERYKNCDEGGLSAFIMSYQSDERAGVAAMVAKAKKQLDTYAKERGRLKELRFFEEKYQADHTTICGIDEAGRGPLAGPVVAGAVVLPVDVEILWVNDSKKLSAKKREILYEEIMEKAVSVGVGMASPAEIDEVNILQATYLAMRRAICDLSVVPDMLLNDAVVIPQVAIQQVGIVKGDQKSVSIAAASIIAKVTRDRLMEDYDEEYPGYGFAEHKGYGTAKHYEALQRLGPSPIHRRTFL
ncbi:MAG: ribonuclease HII [Lachnospiraceae bacterium]|nr:ribonuclease HII [Lachnospiraceae bacterium]